MSAYSDARRAERDADRDGELSGADRGRQRYRDRHGGEAVQPPRTRAEGVAGGSELYELRRTGGRAAAARHLGRAAERDDLDDGYVHDGGRRRGTARGGASMGQGRNPQRGDDSRPGMQSGRDRWDRGRDGATPRYAERGRDPREQRAHRKRIAHQVERARRGRGSSRDDD